jgi:hypothetical protein
VSADALGVAGLAILVGLLVLITWNTWGDIGSDTGYDLVAGTRVAHGEFPYVDFVYYYGPLSPFLLGFAGWIGGSGVGPAVAVGLVLAVAIVAATYALARLLAGPVAAFLAGAIAAPFAFGPSNYSYVLPHSLSASLGILTTLCFLIGVACYVRHGGLRWLVVAGTAAGLTALTRPEFAVAVAVAAVVWVAVRVRRHVATTKEILALAAPGIVIPAAVYGAFLAYISLHRLVLDNLYPVDTLRTGGHAVLRSHAPLTVGSFVSLGGKLVIYALGCVVLVAVSRALDRGGTLRRIALSAVGSSVVAFAAITLARPETVRYYLKFAYGWIPAGIAICASILAVQAFRRDRNWNAVSQVDLVGAVLLAVLAAKTYADFLLYSHVPQLAIYAAPFAALFLMRLHLRVLPASSSGMWLGVIWLSALAFAGIGLTAKDAHAESASVHGPGGTLKASSTDGPLFQAAVRWLDRHTVPGERVLLAPQLTALYVIADRRDPLPEISLIPGALPTPASEREAVVRLERTGVRVAITDGRTFGEYDQTTFGGSFDRLLAGWIHRHFKRVVTLRAPGSVHVLSAWVRRGT